MQVYERRGEDQIAALLDAERGPRVFEHDRRGRLVRERRPDRVVERAMDAVGNVYRRADGQDRRYGRGGLLEAANDERGAVTFTHDADGNRTTKHEPDGTHWTYRWNGHGFLAEVERRSGVVEAARASRVEPDLHLRFTYDAFARRVAKRVEADGDVRETRFVWDGHTVLHELRSALHDDATLDAVGLRSASLDTLALAPATLDTRDEPELTTWYWDPGTFTPVAKERAGRRWSIASDHLGTPTEMYDELGELAWRMQLDVFGVPTFDEGTAEDCPWRWPGQYDDVETGELYNRWRYYDPESGRYSSLDPIRLDGGVGLFEYPDDPTQGVDELGLTRTTPPTLPPSTILVTHDGYRIVHNYNNMKLEHANPIHFYVVRGDTFVARIRADGSVLKGAALPSSVATALSSKPLINRLRSIENKVTAYIRFFDIKPGSQRFSPGNRGAPKCR